MASGNHTNGFQKTTGLRYWMLGVLEECDRVSAGFEADPVHDLRVALRRCRSLADGLMALDPDPNWKAMKKAAKNLFQRLGALRDTQIMMEWIAKLAPETARSMRFARAAAVSGAPDVARPLLPAVSGETVPASAQPHQTNEATSDSSSRDPEPVAFALLRILSAREREQKLEAQSAMEGFDRKQWRHWSKTLPARAARFRPGSALFKHVALERWTAARQLHDRALRNRSQSAFHNLRIGIKRLRYIVENFLPAEHKAWAAGLKEIQDLLGEVHDFDVLWATAVSLRVFPDPESRRCWRERILTERTKRIERYRAKAVGPHSLWITWRAGLPQGKQIQVLATRRMKLWAGGLDPDFVHSERVASLALQLYDGLLASGWKPSADLVSARSSLLAAALLHDVGKAKGQKGHHKASFNLIRSHGNPLGWNAADLQRAAIIARFHRGALPTRKHKSLQDLLPIEQKAAIQLSAVLRLANSFDAAHDGHIRRIHIIRDGLDTGQRARRVSHNGFLRPGSAHQPLIIGAEGYSSTSASARTIAAERHLLETVLRRPVLIKAMKPS
jgi:CHAD domain-containing protein/HD superfamily phosphodiesterase